MCPRFFTEWYVVRNDTEAGSRVGGTPRKSSENYGYRSDDFVDEAPP